MVCSDNICRSPLAAAVLKNKLQQKGVEANVDSAGFEPYHIGDKPDELAIAFAKSKGLDISDHSMRLFTKKDFDIFDRIFTMDHRGYKDLIFMARNEDDKKKVEYLLNMILPGQNRMVPNPYSGEMIKLESAYRLINKACDKIAESIDK